MPKGFTLVELLVVMAIIGILVGMLLPAVEAAREAARKATCMNNVKQLALGGQQHESAQGIFPSNGWGWCWNGDADRGFTKMQPASWIYNVLPYIGEQRLHDLDAGKPYGTETSVSLNSDGSLPNVVNKQTAMLTRTRTPLAIMNCPSRRRSTLYPLIWWGNIGYCGNVGAIALNPPAPNMCARSDYAANCGSAEVDEYDGGPPTLQAGDSPTYPWRPPLNGVCYLRSEVKAASITDGTSNTIFCGEKFVSPDSYYNGVAAAENGTMYDGFENDNSRSTDSPPLRDLPGYNDSYHFGAAHYGGCHFGMCDGSVRRISYGVDPRTFQYLGSRNDGQAIDPTKL